LSVDSTAGRILIDGAAGEGGGQILRTALTLSLVTAQPFRIEKIRANRTKPGLLRQHLAAVQAAAAVGGCSPEGAALGSQELTFAPSGAAPGDYFFAVGTAGSATLVLQTVLPALIVASGPSTLILEGGTHNPSAPPFDFLERAFLPLLRRMGADVHAVLERPGFYPAGGGRIRVTIRPAQRLEPLELLERGAITRKLARAIVARLPLSIAARELKSLAGVIELEENEQRAEQVKNSAGPGNILLVEIESQDVCEVFAGFGRRGVPAEAVAREAGESAARYLQAGVPVGEHLADQLLVPMALAGAGAFVSLPPTQHALTNAEVIQKFLDVRIAITREAGEAHRFEMQS